MSYNVCFADDGTTLRIVSTYTEALAIQTHLQKVWKEALIVKVSE